MKITKIADTALFAILLAIIWLLILPNAGLFVNLGKTAATIALAVFYEQHALNTIPGKTRGLLTRLFHFLCQTVRKFTRRLIEITCEITLPQLSDAHQNDKTYCCTTCKAAMCAEHEEDRRPCAKIAVWQTYGKTLGNTTICNAIFVGFVACTVSFHEQYFCLIPLAVWTFWTHYLFHQFTPYLDFDSYSFLPIRYPCAILIQYSALLSAPLIAAASLISYEEAGTALIWISPLYRVDLTFTAIHLSPAQIAIALSLVLLIYAYSRLCAATHRAVYPSNNTQFTAT